MKQQEHSNRQDNDLVLPLNPQNKFLNFIVRSKKINSTAYKSTLLCIALGAIIFIILSIAFFRAMNNVVTTTIPYYSSSTDTCKQANTMCQVSFSLEEEMENPVYVLYQLDDFFQNNRIFIQSKSNTQLSGNVIDTSQAQVCHPFRTNRELGVTKSWAGVQLNPQAIASPCGSIARVYFNDTFSIFDSTGRNISISENGISWPGDKGGPFKRAPNSSSTQWIDPQDERFINWMRTAGLINFKKLWGIIQQPLRKGNYTIKILNNYRMQGWDGGKFIVLSTSSTFGGQNYTLPIILLLFSIIFIVTDIYIIFRVRKLKKMSNQ